MATLVVLWGVCTITFFLLHLTPGDPVDIMLGENVSAQDRQNFRHELGLDLSLMNQYKEYFRKLVHGDMGRSYLSHNFVMDDLKTYLPATFELAGASILFAVIVGIPFGIWSAVSKNKWVEKFTFGYSLLGMSMPSFWLAPLLILIFSIRLDLLPVSERNGFSSIILPALSLGFGLSAVLVRMTRASFLDVLKENYIRVAESKGLSGFKVYFKHALKNALTPIATTLGLQLGAVLTGVVIIETIFDWPGLGILLYNSLQERNYPEVQGCVLTISVIYVLVNFVTDLTYLIINPRLRNP